MKNIFSKWLESRKQRQAIAKGDLIRQQFQVCERNGYIWITCNGIAVKRISTEASALQISDAIDCMRNDAINYEMN